MRADSRAITIYAPVRVYRKLVSSLNQINKKPFFATHGYVVENGRFKWEIIFFVLKYFRDYIKLNTITLSNHSHVDSIHLLGLSDFTDVNCSQHKFTAMVLANYL